MDLHTTRPRFKSRLVRNFLPNFRLITTIYNSIKLSVRWCVWKVGEGFPGPVTPKTSKWVAMYSSVTFHINGYHSYMSALYLFTVTGWGVKSCVCGMAFLCGSTLVKVSLLQAGTIVIRPQMFKSDVKPKTKQMTINCLGGTSW